MHRLYGAAKNNALETPRSAPASPPRAGSASCSTAGECRCALNRSGSPRSARCHAVARRAEGKFAQAPAAIWYFRPAASAETCWSAAHWRMRKRATGRCVLKSRRDVPKSARGGADASGASEAQPGVALRIRYFADVRQRANACYRSKTRAASRNLPAASIASFISSAAT